jgi:predicted RNase H-like HicB family nuclease
MSSIEQPNCVRWGTLVDDRKEIAGASVELYAEKRGFWRITLPDGGDSLAHGKDLERVESNAAAAIRKMKVKVSVPFFTADGEQGLATGVHAGNNSILAKVDGDATQVSTYGRNTLRGDTPSEVLAELQGSIEAEHQASRKRKQITEEYGFDLRKAVLAAIAEKTGGES